MGSRRSSFTVEPPSTTPEREWHPQQLAIFDWFETSFVSGNSRLVKDLIVNACAGTGKTTTLIEGVNRAPDQYVLVCAFNKNIADELTARTTRENVDAKTLHSLGYFFIRREWSRIPVAERGARAEQLTQAVVPANTPLPIRKLINVLHTKGRDLIPTSYSVKELALLAVEHDLEPDEGWGIYTAEWIAQVAYDAMRYAAETPPSYDVGVDFADMMFLPFTWNLLEAMYDLVVVDEMQDMSKPQLQMAQAVCRGRMAGFGDRRQAIYGFRGADTDSLDRIKTELQAGELPLTITYRCAQAVAREAQKLVPAIEAATSNPEGSVSAVDYTAMLTDVSGGNFILSRLNAPLVTITLRLLLMRKKARMRGRDIGAGLVGLIRRLTRNVTSTSITVLEERLDEWERKTTTKLAGAGLRDQADKVRDQAAMVRAFAEDCTSIVSLVQDIEKLFVDTADADTVICSSIHKAKGLEAPTVYVLQETLYRRGVTPEEENLDYVATTRAKTHLRKVYGVPGQERR